MRPDTLFRISSMAKALTAACVPALADDGALDLDASVEGLLPEQADGRAVVLDRCPGVRVLAAGHPSATRARAAGRRRRLPAAEVRGNALPVTVGTVLGGALVPTWRRLPWTSTLDAHWGRLAATSQATGAIA